MAQPTLKRSTLRLPLAAVFAAATLAAGTIGPANASLLVNGGFETGDFTGWVQLGNTGFTGVACPGPGPNVAEGNCSAFLGPSGSDGTLAQGFNTVVGQHYLITFDFLSDGSAPGDFSAVFDGVTLVSLTDPPASGGFKSFSFVETATVPNSTLAFNFRNDSGLYYLDAVSVAAPEPASMALVGVALAGLWAGRRRKMQ